MGERQRPKKDQREKRLPPFPLKFGDGSLTPVSGNSGHAMSEAVNARDRRV
jgi:hypothetical protein